MCLSTPVNLVWEVFMGRNCDILGIHVLKPLNPVPQDGDRAFKEVIKGNKVI